VLHGSVDMTKNSRYLIMRHGRHGRKGQDGALITNLRAPFKAQIRSGYSLHEGEKIPAIAFAQINVNDP